MSLTPWSRATGHLALAALLLVPCVLPAQEPAPGKGRPADGTRAGEEWAGTAAGMTFCWCPAGKFVMGSPKGERGRQDDEDQAEVTLARGFWMGKHEVTSGVWRKVMGAPHRESSRVDARPVRGVRWEEAAGFCARLTAGERERGALPVGWEYRLPTEAQWEYACRAGTTTAYSCGGDVGRLTDFGWYYGNANGNGPFEVGLKRANPWGLHDVHGNVWEWCRDYYRLKLPGGTDPEVTATDPEVVAQKADAHRVYRGGSHIYVPEWSRSAFRLGRPTTPGYASLGLRVALVRVGP